MSNADFVTIARADLLELIRCFHDPGRTRSNAQKEAARRFAMALNGNPCPCQFRVPTYTRKVDCPVHGDRSPAPAPSVLES